MQRNRFIVAHRWMRGSRSDLALAQSIAGSFPARATFHAQQASEMALKAVLIALTDDHPTTQAASELVRELRRTPFTVPDAVASAGASLDLYYLASRYPDAVGDADPLDIVSAEDAALALTRSLLVIDYAAAALAGVEEAESH